MRDILQMQLQCGGTCTVTGRRAADGQVDAQVG